MKKMSTKSFTDQFIGSMGGRDLTQAIRHIENLDHMGVLMSHETIHARVYKEGRRNVCQELWKRVGYNVFHYHNRPTSVNPDMAGVMALSYSPSLKAVMVPCDLLHDVLAIGLDRSAIKTYPVPMLLPRSHDTPPHPMPPGRALTSVLYGAWHDCGGSDWFRWTRQMGFLRGLLNADGNPMRMAREVRDYYYQSGIGSAKGGVPPDHTMLLRILKSRPGGFGRMLDLMDTHGTPEGLLGETLRHADRFRSF